MLAGGNEACIDRGFARKSEPWEQSEGGIYLLRELSAVAPDRAQKFLPVLVELVPLHISSQLLSKPRSAWECNSI